ncbi:MAG: 7-carboxy-7-deazaguanine synthase [Myxococcales bacterium]|nr:7-carboxy-7-deazaguanine synthase [Myxococcales bacterium]
MPRSYTVKELFFTLQGEGAQTGRAAVFLRFTGCNLWTGREADRGKGPGVCSQWCDTDFVGTNGPGGGRFSNAESLAEAVRDTWAAVDTPESKYVVCTGGEPLLQLDGALIDALHAHGFSVAVETNGTLAAPAGVDWICVSPKGDAPLAQRHGHELKLVYPQENAQPERFEGLSFERFYLQPLDGPEREMHTRAAIEYCKAHPRWRLSMQTHKTLNIP